MKSIVPSLCLLLFVYSNNEAKSQKSSTNDSFHLTTGPEHRIKRDVQYLQPIPPDLTVKIKVAYDEALKNHLGGEEAAAEYVHHVVEIAKTFYVHPSLGTRIHIVVVEEATLIQNKMFGIDPYNSGSDGRLTIRDANIVKKEEPIPLVIFTYTDDTDMWTGTAAQRSVCDESKGIIITKYRSDLMKAAKSLSHDFGHTLGLYHDIDEDRRNAHDPGHHTVCAEEGLMSDMAPGMLPSRWSICSSFRLQKGYANGILHCFIIGGNNDGSGSGDGSSSGDGSFSGDDYDYDDDYPVEDYGSVSQGNRLTSTNFPNMYPNNEDTVQTLSVQGGYNMLITFQEFKLETHGTCAYDYVQICDENNLCGKKLCGSSLPDPITVSTSTASVVFHSDGSESRKGFSLTYKKIRPVAAIDTCNNRHLECLNNSENKTCYFDLKLSEKFTDSPGRFADGFPRPVLVYNDLLPGPTIAVCQGDTVKVELTNNASVPTTLHFHGIREQQKSSSHLQGWSDGGPWSDGVPHITQCPINPTESFTYTFLGSGSIGDLYNNAPAGTYWYHSHVGSQRMNGAAGKLIIMPRESWSDIDIDNPDNSLFLQEWYPNDTNNIPTSLLVNGKGKQSNQIHQLQCSGDEDDCIRNHKEGQHVVFTLVDNIHYTINNSTNYEMFYINEPGQSYRFRIIGAIGDNFPIRISIEDHQFTAISTDSVDIEPVHNLTALWITAGERYDIVIKTKTDREYQDHRSAYKINIFHDKITDNPITEHIVLCSLAWLKYPSQTVDNTDEANCDEMKNATFTKVLNPVPNEYSMWENTNPTEYIFPADLTALVNADNNQKSLNTQYVTLDGMTFNSISMKYPDTPFLFQSPSNKTGRCGTVCNSAPNTCTDHMPDDGRCGSQYSLLSSSNQCTCQHVIQQPYHPHDNSWFEIILINPGIVAHPIHQHGGWYNIVGMGQLPLRNGTFSISRELIMDFDKACVGRKQCLPRNFIKPVYKDTVQVPTNGYVILRTPLDNIGAWIVHCHINYHVQHGMAMVLQIGEPDKWSMGPNQINTNRNKNLKC